jgi:hypothetical protein
MRRLAGAFKLIRAARVWSCFHDCLYIPISYLDSCAYRLISKFFPNFRCRILLISGFFIMDAKDTIAQNEHDHSSHSGDSEEKGVAPANAYPINDEDYEVTFKTWIVVAILASAYGVCLPTF